MSQCVLNREVLPYFTLCHYKLKFYMHVCLQYVSIIILWQYLYIVKVGAYLCMYLKVIQYIRTVHMHLILDTNVCTYMCTDYHLEKKSWSECLF